MERKKAIWSGVWILSFFSVFLICVFFRSSTAAGAFILAGIILAVIAQIVFGSATWATTPQSVGYSRGTHPAMISSTLIRETGKERYFQEEKETEWSIGFGLTIIGILVFLGGLLASVYLRYTG
ncbi:MAG: hypothetical protein QW531_01465 [Thermoplasmata archaeon]